MTVVFSRKNRPNPASGSQAFARHFAWFVLVLLAAGQFVARAQDTQLKGLTAVNVVVVWSDAPISDRDGIQTGIETNLRRAGMRVLTAAEQMGSLPMLYIWASRNGAAVPICVQLQERVFLARDAASDAATSARATVSFERARFAPTWERIGVAQTVQSAQEAVQKIEARYSDQRIFVSGPAEKMMELEIQAAIADAQRPILGTVRDRIKEYVDQFLEAWLTANSKGTSGPVIFGPACSGQSSLRKLDSLSGKQPSLELIGQAASVTEGSSLNSCNSAK